MPPKWPDKKNEMRCKWYNDVGWPRINPEKVRLGHTDITGCMRDDSICHFAHPNEGSIWANAKLARPPSHKEYPDSILPRTPTPPWPGSTRTDTRSPYVKQEPRSPPASSASFTLDTSKAASHHSRSRSHSRIDSQEHSPMQSRSNRLYNSNRETFKDNFDSGNRKVNHFHDFKQDASRGRNLGYPREREWDRRKSISDYKRRERTPGRGEIDRTNTFSGVPTSPLDKSQSIRRYSSDNLKTQEPPIEPSSNSMLAKGRVDPQDHDINMSSGMSSDPPAPSHYPPPSSKRGSSIASSTAAPPPDSAATLAMPPPETPFSAISTTVGHVPPTFPTFPIPDIPRKEKLSDEDNYKVWDKRIELLSVALLARRELKKNLEELKQLEGLGDSYQTLNLPSTTKERFAAVLKATKLKCEASRAKAELTHKQISALDFWPVRRSLDSTGESNEVVDKLLEEKNEKLLQDEHREVKKEVGELGDLMSRLDRQLKEVITFVTSSRPGFSENTLPSNSSITSANAVPMDVDTQSDPPRGVKRRKTGDGENTYTSDTASVSPQKQQSPATTQMGRKEHKLISHQIKSLESRFEELENMFYQSADHENDEITSIVEIELEKVRNDIKRLVKRERETIIQTENNYHSGLQDDLAILKGEINSLSMRATAKPVDGEARDAEKYKLQLEYEQLCDAVKKGKLRTDELQEQIRASTEEAKALRRLVELAHRPPQSPSVDELVDLILPRVMDTVRGEMEERFMRHREEIINLIREGAPRMETLNERVNKIASLPEAYAILRNPGYGREEPNGSNISPKNF